MKDTTIAHYKVLHELGRGGMGVVCKAHDLRLGRDVALKFLPPALTLNASSRERLIGEARAVSKLDHPNVCTVHEIEETEDGQIVIIMAYYEGETLADRLRRGRVELHEAIHIARFILLGLEHAHQRGVIHRDIKPSNVILCANGGVKIVDFGLAWFNPGDETLTNDALGTLAYLEPEMSIGQPPDSRTDLWSCGVVLYEMLAGVQPFTGENAAALLGAISRNTSRPLQCVRPDLPVRVYEIVSRALGKRRATRYQSAGEFIADLEQIVPAARVRGASTPVPLVQAEELGEKSLVVLPFVDVDSCAETEHFSDGLTDEIITDLSGIRHLRVICRTSAMRLKGTQKDAREIAAELNVKYVLEGTVRIKGQQLRVNAKLVDSASESALWADKFSGSLEDVFSIQEEVSHRIVQALEVKLTHAESQRLREHPIDDIRAYEYYLRARRELLAYSRPALENALDYIQKGEQLIGENILLLSARGYVHWQFVNAGVDSNPEHLNIAAACAKRILELQSDSPHGVRLLGLVAVLESRTQDAVHYLKQSLKLAPNDPDTIAWFCAVCALSGKGHEVLAMARRLVEIDPLTPTYHFVPGLVALLSGNPEGAIAPFEQTLAGDPDNPMLRFCVGHALLMNSRFEEAIAAFESLGHEMPEDFFAHLGLVLRYGLARDVNNLRTALTAEVASIAASDMNYAWVVGQGWALSAETHDALHWLELAVDHGFINYPLLSRFDPTLRSIRDDPEFALLLEKTRKRWEAFKV